MKDKKIGKYDLTFPVFPCLEGRNSCRGIPDSAPAPITGHETVITVRGDNQDDHHDQESGWGDRQRMPGVRQQNGVMDQ